MVFQMQLAKTQEAVPRSRDYIAARQAQLSAGDMHRAGLMIAAE